MNRQPQHRGQSSGVRHLAPLIKHGSEPATGSEIRLADRFNFLSYQRALLHSLHKKQSYGRAAIIKLSHSFIYTTAEPQGQQITHAIKFKSPNAGNRSSPTRQVHWPLLQPLSLWRFPNRPAAQTGAFSHIPAPRPPHIWFK